MESMAIQAHRGSPDPAMGIRENTLDAFLRARQLGADGVELDVRMTSDGALAVHHDPIIAGVGPISGLTAGQLPDFVPLLAAALDACHGLTVNVEIKNLPGEPGFDPRPRDPRGGRSGGGGGGASSVVISSFWPATPGGGPRCPPRPGHRAAAGPVVRSRRERGRATARGCTAIHPHLDLVDGDLVARAHEAGLAVAVWTVNDRSPWRPWPRRRRHRHHRRRGPGPGHAGGWPPRVEPPHPPDQRLPVTWPPRGPGALTRDPGANWSGGDFRQQCTPMNVVVCVKQIPDPAAPAALDPGTKNLVRAGKLILDDSDAYGVEMALQLADAAGGGEVTLVSMAPNGETSGPAYRPGHGGGQGHPDQ